MPRLSSPSINLNPAPISRPGSIASSPQLLSIPDQRRPQISDGELEDWQIYDAASHTSDQGRSAEDVALDGIVDLDVRAALEAMPEEFRMAVYLADVEGFSYKEIAEIVGVPSGTVMSRLHRGRKLLRSSLAQYAKDRGFNREKSGGSDE